MSAAMLYVTQMIAVWTLINNVILQTENPSNPRAVQLSVGGYDSAHHCKANYNISFIKIHKTGSGSFHNKLARIALEKKLFVALPKCARAPKDFQVFPEKARAKFLYNAPLDRKFRGYNMFLDHAVFDRKTQMDYLPSDVKFVTQLRHPYEQARSLFEHFTHGGYKTNKFDAFMDNTSREDCKVKLRGCYSRRSPEISLTRNFQSFALGYNKALKENSTTNHFNAFVTYLDNVVNFVSILELKDESSVLMKRKFCWNMKDILELHTHKSLERNTLLTPSDRLLKQHELWSPLDYRLYNHFKQKLLDDIKAQPKEFHEEVAAYGRVNAQFEQFCQDMCTTLQSVRNIADIRAALNYSITIPVSKFNAGFTISYLDCLLSMAQEQSLQNVLKFHQFSDVCTNSTLMEEYGMSAALCDQQHHVYPGFHYHYFQRKVLSTENCKSRRYIDFQLNHGI